jgi:hypothetical protein
VVARTQNRKRTSARRAAQARARQEERRRLRRWIIGLVVLGAVVAAFVLAQGGGGSKSASKSTKTANAPHTDVATATVGGPPGPEGIPLQEGKVLAPGATPAGGATVDGIQCQASEQVAYHIHSHLTVYVDGVLRPLPAGIGIVQPVAQQTPNGPFYGATTCYYWLHVHAQDGVIHVESPSVHPYTLGQFFALWGQPLSATGIGSASGPLTVFVDGRPYQGDPAAIALGSHEDIQIDVGNPVVPPQKVTWANGL